MRTVEHIQRLQAATGLPLVLHGGSGILKEYIMDGIRADPQTYADWRGNGAWEIETDGKEDGLYSQFLRTPFAKAVADGLIPADLQTLAGTWGAVHDSGELTYMNVVHLPGIDGTDPDDLTRGEMEGRRAAMHAVAALRSYPPGGEGAACSGLRENCWQGKSESGGPPMPPI
jgi:hypothetical protein